MKNSILSNQHFASLFHLSPSLLLLGLLFDCFKANPRYRVISRVEF